MVPEDSQSADWQPEDYFARVAARREMSPEQLRARLRGLVDEVAEGHGHLSFERLRDAMLNEAALSEQELSHLDRCKYCSKFLQTVNPSAAEVKRFVSAAEIFADRSNTHIANVGVSTEPRAGRTRRWAYPATLVAGLIVGSVGVTAWHTFKPSASGTSDLLASAELDCLRTSGNPKACALYAKAAQYQVDGDTAKAQQLVTSGLIKTGVSAPVVGEVSQVLKTLPTSPDKRDSAIAKADAAAALAATAGNAKPARWLEMARLHLEAGQESQAYSAVAKYLTVYTAPKQAAAFVVGFVQPVNKLELYTATDTSAAANETVGMRAAAEVANDAAANPSEPAKP